MAKCVRYSFYEAAPV